MNPNANIPRVNGALLPGYLGRRVRLVGRVVDVTQGILETSDAMQVRILYQHGQTPQSTYIEVIGVVQSDGSIHEEMTVSFGETFHLGNYDQVIQLSALHPGPFS